MTLSLHAIITVIQQTSGKNAKRAVLEAHKDNELLQQYLKAVYDPRINYYITKLPKPLPNITGVVRDFGPDDVEDMTEEIASRQFTGKQAKALIAAKLAVLDEQGKALLGYLIGRDIKAGIAENSILSVWPGLFYVPPYQRCASMDADLKERFGMMPHFYVQTKSDGQFCYAINRKSLGLAFDTVLPQAMSRAGSLYPQWLANHITYGVPEGYVAMGELLVEKHTGEMYKTLDRKTGNGILNSILSGDGSKFDLRLMRVKFVAWDLVTEEEFDAGKSDRDYELRWHDLCTKTSLERIPSWVVSSLKAANKIHQEHVARGEEGTVWKNPKMKWRDCSSGDKDMMKAKLVFEAEFRIKGCYEGEGKAAGMLGGVELATEDDLIQFNCGSGFSDDQRAYLWCIRDSLPGKIMTVEGNDIVTSKSKPGVEAVFLPIAIEIRNDRTEADTRARVWEQFNAAKEAKQ